MSAEYRIDAGDSNVGPVGFVMYVTARSKKAALKAAKEKIEELGAHYEMTIRFVLYFNPDALTLDDVERVT